MSIEPKENETALNTFTDWHIDVMSVHSRSSFHEDIYESIKIDDDGLIDGWQKITITINDTRVGNELFYKLAHEGTLNEAKQKAETIYNQLKEIVG